MSQTHKNLCSSMPLSQSKPGEVKTLNYDTIKWPAQSPNLNPIENLWKLLGEKVTGKKPTTCGLWRRLQEG